MIPVHAEFDANHVQHKVEDVHKDALVRDPRVGLGREGNKCKENVLVSVKKNINEKVSLHSQVAWMDSYEDFQDSRGNV